jgi:hypothetical protein
MFTLIQSGHSDGFMLFLFRRFAIDNTTGRVFTISENPPIDLDRELVDTFYLSVDAIDGGGLCTSCKLIVKLNDLNDNAPKFLPKHKLSFMGSIEENSIKWLENVYLMAVDADLGSNAFIQYEIIGGDFYHMFDIDSDNSNRLVLKNNKTLDFEELFKSINKTTNLFNNNEILINLVVEARDGGTPSLSDKALINVIVKVNLHSFLRSLTCFSLKVFRQNRQQIRQDNKIKPDYQA